MIIVNLLLFVLAMAVEGFSLACMWNWFLFPIIGYAVNFWHAIGISLTASMFISSNSSNKGKELWEQLVTSIGVSLILWGFGAVVHLFM